MSLFDVVRYPIDERFEPEDLSRIPQRALHDWWYLDIMKVSRFRAIALGYGPQAADIYTMTVHMRHPEETQYLPAMARMLRKRIEQL